ncbi:MAG: glycyl-radical enzyme activating protein [Clostridia bacterium]|nr:glycyl-radical enzyme activating protein [Clostridia bacterium]
MPTATVFDIKRNSYVDGPGIRTTVFLKGCNLRCAWCHSPESQRAEKEILFYRDRCVGCGRCAGISVKDENFVCYSGAKEICGKDYSVEELAGIILRDKVFYDATGGGVTFSGGECMLQEEFLAKILSRCKQSGVGTAVDTAGNVPWESFEKILSCTDYFLYDLKCVSPDLHLAGTGVSNERILTNLSRLCASCPDRVIIRVPVVPGFNTGKDELEKMAAFLGTLRFKKLELLPYHKMGEAKYAALGLEMKAFDLPSDELMEKCEKILRGL